MQTTRLLPRRNLIALTMRTTQHTLPKLQVRSQPQHLLCLQKSQTRPSSFLHNDAPSSPPGPSRPPQKTARESWFSRIRRRRDRNARPRSKISTLALDHTQHPLSFGADAENESKGNNDTKSDQELLVRRRRRKLLLWAAVLSMPIWGQDVIEAVVPGTLGLVIFVGGGVKKGVGWVRTHLPGREP